MQETLIESSNVSKLANPIQPQITFCCEAKTVQFMVLMIKKAVKLMKVVNCSVLWRCSATKLLKRL